MTYQCTICHEGFPTSFSRSSHLARNHLDLLCRQCNRYYLSRASLEQHYRNDPGHPSCSICGEGFPMIQQLNTHLSSAHPPISCGPCGLLFQQQSLLDAHLLESGLHPVCNVCKRGFQDTISFDQHVMSHHEDMYCDVCAIGFQSAEQLHLHFRASDWERHPTCVLCNTAFKDHTMYNEHMVARHPPTPIVLPVTPRSFSPVPPNGSSSSSSTPTSSSASLMSSPIIVHAPQVHTCTKCTKNFMRMRDLLRHYKDSPMHPTCVPCGMGFFDDLAFLEHKITTHKTLRPGHSRSSSIRTTPSPQGVFKLDEDLKSPVPDVNNTQVPPSLSIPPSIQEPTASPAHSTASNPSSMRSKGKARHIPTEFAMTASPFPPESPAVAYEYANDAPQAPSNLGGSFEVIPELAEPVSYPETPTVTVKAEDNSPSYGSAPSTPELESSPTTRSNTPSPSPSLAQRAPLHDPYSPPSDCSSRSRPSIVDRAETAVERAEEDEQEDEEEAEAEYAAVAAATISAPGTVSRGSSTSRSSRPSSRASAAERRQEREQEQEQEQEQDRRSEGGFVTAREEQHHSRYHTPSPIIASSQQSSASASSSRASSRPRTHTRKASTRSRTSSSRTDTTDRSRAQATRKSDGVKVDSGRPCPSSSGTKDKAAEGSAKPSMWSCRKCLKEPHEPTATVCGHIFCHACLISELMKSFQCPACRRMLLVPLFVEN